MSRFPSRLQTVGIAAGLIAAGLFAVDPLGAQTVPPPDDVGPIIGLYTTQTIGDDTAVELEVPTVPSFFDVWVVLSHTDSEYIRGAEFRIEKSPELAAGIVLAYIQAGDPAFEYWSYPNLHIVFTHGFRPVVDGHAWLARIVYLAIHPGLDGQFFLAPPSVGGAIPGEMAFIGDSDPIELEIMRPNSEGQLHTNPVFSLTTGTVPVEAHSLSAIKALFR
jgi:hypothetical protein